MFWEGPEVHSHRARCSHDLASRSLPHSAQAELVKTMQAGTWSC